MRMVRVEPQQGQESVWDYSRPPRAEASKQCVRVVFGGLTIAQSVRAKRVLETSHPPVYYLPQTDVEMAYLTPTERATFCEFKGSARYWSLRVGDRESLDAAWSYPDPLRVSRPSATTSPFI